MKKVKIYPMHKVVELKKELNENVLPHTQERIDTGFRCEHGVYIPVTASDPNHAPYCSLCYPYVIEVKH